METLNTEVAIWERIIHPEGEMSREAASHIVQLAFPAAEQLRMHELAEKNQQGVLTVEEESELDHYCRVGNTLSLLKSRARKILKPRRRSS